MSIAAIKSTHHTQMREWQDTAFRDQISTANGRRVLAVIIMDMARHDSSSQGIDDRTTSYREGQRAVGAALIERIRNLDPEAWVRIQTERISDERSSKQNGK